MFFPNLGGQVSPRDDMREPTTAHESDLASEIAKKTNILHKIQSKSVKNIF